MTRISVKFEPEPKTVKSIKYYINVDKLKKKKKKFFYFFLLFVVQAALAMVATFRHPAVGVTGSAAAIPVKYEYD